MNLIETIKDKSLKPKQKTEFIAASLHSGNISIEEIILTETKLNAATLATCIEAIELATRAHGCSLSSIQLQWIIDKLSMPNPRIKWEAAKVIGNAIAYHKQMIETAVTALIANTKHEGTVVRWSAAYALAAIVILDTPINKELIPTVNELINTEEKESIKKIYRKSLKAVNNGLNTPITQA